jgi:hypothetical protein
LLSYFFVPEIQGELWIQWLHQMVLFLLPYYFKGRLDVFRIFLPQGIYEMSKWSHWPLGLAWEWTLNLVMGIEVLSPSWSFSSVNIPLHCITVQKGTCTTGLNLSGASFRILHVLSIGNTTLYDLNTKEGRRWVYVIKKEWVSDEVWSRDSMPPSTQFASVSLFYNL